MDLSCSCSHLQRCLIEESDELGCEENDHLLSEELCRLTDTQMLINQFKWHHYIERFSWQVMLIEKRDAQD